MAPHERLILWEPCYELILKVYKVTRTYPRDELYGITAQTRRAAFSIGANIAEGAAKRGRAEFGRYLDISIGSLAELAFALRLAKDLHILSEDTWNEVELLRNRVGFLTWNLYRAVRPKRP